MKACYCDLCGTALPRTEYLYDIVDTRDRYKRYHHKHWNICDECHEELVARRKKVIETIISNSENNNNNNTSCTITMIEIQLRRQMVTVRYVNNQYEIIESYFENRKLAKSFKKLYIGTWIEYVMIENDSIFDRSSYLCYLQELFMIGIYDFSVELDDPRPMNHSNLIAIFSYMMHRTEEDVDNSFRNNVQSDFLTSVCGVYDSKKAISDFGLPQLEVDWGEYKAVFTSAIDTDGLDVELYYKEGRKRPSLDNTSGNVNRPESGDKDHDGSCKPQGMFPWCIHHKDKPMRLPLYNSPYENHYWYELYNYYTGYKNVRPIEVHKDGKDYIMLEIEKDENIDEIIGENGESILNDSMELVWSERIPHNTLITDIEIYQQ